MLRVLFAISFEAIILQHGKDCFAEFSSFLGSFSQDESDHNFPGAMEPATCFVAASTREEEARRTTGRFDDKGYPACVLV